MIRKTLCLILCLAFFLSCGPQQNKVEKVIEDGIEVVINHLEPYKIKGEPSDLFLVEEFRIDIEEDKFIKIGLVDISAFDLDSEGNIYFYQVKENDENLVYKFDKKGNFMMSFGKRGQGPGEIQTPIYQRITSQDEIPVQNYGIPKLYVFDRDGTLIRETQISLKIDGNITPLENGNFLLFRDYFEPSLKHRYDILSLYNSKWEKIRELDRIDYGPFVMITPKKKGSPRVFICELSDGKIYLGNENRGYEILIYNLDGSLLKKIRKEYDPIDVLEEFKEILLVNFGSFKEKLIFPNKMPPFHYFFLDDEQRLYVKTYEKGEDKGEYMHDVFNSSGIFIARKSMAGYGSWSYPGRKMNRAKIKNQHLYCIQEKESGYKELVVYKMRWE